LLPPILALLPALLVKPPAVALRPHAQRTSSVLACDAQKPPPAPPVRSTEVDSRGFVVPQVGDIVKMPSKWPGEWEVAQVDFVQTIGSKGTTEVDLLPLKNVGDNLFRLPGRKPAAIRADIAKLGRLESEYVREIDSYRVDERQLQPLVPRPPPRPSVTEQGLKEYAALKAEILRESAIVGVVGAVICYPLVGVDGATAFLLGAASGCAYLALLSTEIDGFGPGATPPPKPLAIAASSRLLVPVALMAGLAARELAAKGGAGFGTLSVLPKETFVCAALGFLSYKAPLLAKQVAAGVKDLTSMEAPNDESISVGGMPGGSIGFAVRALKKAGREKEKAAAEKQGQMEKAQPKQLVLAGPSGVGKSTLVARLLQAEPGRFGFSVSSTTRDPRPGEVDGVDYNFVSTAEFDDMVARGEFIEWAAIGGQRYGTTVSAVRKVSEEGKVCVLDVDIQGVEAIVARPDLEPYCVWIAPPSFGALRERLTLRGTEDEDEISRRVARARDEIEFSLTTRCFDKVVVNDNLSTAFDELRQSVLQVIGPST